FVVHPGSFTLVGMGVVVVRDLVHAQRGRERLGRADHVAQAELLRAARERDETADRGGEEGAVGGRHGARGLGDQTLRFGAGVGATYRRRSSAAPWRSALRSRTSRQAHGFTSSKGPPAAAARRPRPSCAWLATAACSEPRPRPRSGTDTIRNSSPFAACTVS